MLSLLTMKKNNFTFCVIFKNRKELETARVAYLVVIAITITGIAFFVQLTGMLLYAQKLNFVDTLSILLVSFGGLYIASFIIFTRKRVHLEEEDGPRRTACNDN